jgi:hypothetical protein
MSEVTRTIASQLPQPDKLAAELPPVRNLAMLTYVTLSLFMGLLVHQTIAIERGSWQYYCFVAIAIVPPLFGLLDIVKSLLDRCRLLLFFLLLAGSWQLLVGDTRAAAQLLLFVYVLTWLSTDRATLDTRDLAKLYVALIFAGMIILEFTTFNPYSLVPGRAIAQFGVWRVSFFPNIAFSGILSLSMLLILTRDAKSARSHLVLIAVATYFLMFSFVRAAFLSALMYLMLRLWFVKWREPRPRLMFWIALCVTLGFIAASAFSPRLLYEMQDYPWVSALLLRGKTNMTIGEIAYQLYRPWLWNQQLNLFVSSPWWMGWGSADFYELVSRTIKDPDTMLISAGSEALPTRLLVVYGVPGLLFTVYLVVRLRKLAFEDDRWACACFPALFTLMMSWGSVFHPVDALFVILLLIMTRGAKGFTTAATGTTGEAAAVGAPPVVAQGR